MAGAAPAYRDARPDDCGMLADFAARSFAHTFGDLYAPADLAAFLAASYSPAQQYVELIDQARAARLCLAGEELVGFAQAGPLKLPIDPGPARAIELYRLYVRENFKGTGVAAALMAWCLDWAAGQAADALYLGVWSENIRAQRFYARYGFAKVGEYGFAVGTAVDLEWILRRAM